MWVQIHCRGPGLKHKHINEAQWIASYKKPPWMTSWRHLGRKIVSFLNTVTGSATTFARATSLASERTSGAGLHHGFYVQINPRGLDFRHKGTEEALWIEGYKKRTWVNGQLKVAAAQLFESDTSTRRERGYKKSSGSWDVRTVCKMRVWVWNKTRGPDCRHKGTEEALWIESYKKPAWIDGQLEGGAAQVFQSDTAKQRDGIHKKSFGTWDVRTLCNTGQLKKALHSLNQGGILADSITYISILQECTKMKSLAEGKQVHAHIIQSGFKPDILLHNTLVNMYAKSGSMVDARLVFDNMPEQDVFTWNIMIAGYAKNGCGREAFKIYEQMLREGMTPDNVTFSCLLKACASLEALLKGIEVHADMIKTGIEPDIILENTLVDMYAKCRSMKDARQVFDKMTKRDLFTWRAMIAGYAKQGCSREAFEIYEQMIRTGVTPNSVTFSCILNACASLEKGIEIHTEIIKAGMEPDIILDTALIAMYVKCRSMKDARRVFNSTTQRNVVSWTVMITGYAKHGCGWEALQIYEQMICEGVTPDKVTFLCVLNACASLTTLQKGIEVHSAILKAGIVSDIIVDTALVDMYAKCGSINDACLVFNNMARRNVVSWNVMIGGYAQHGRGTDAFKTYKKMILEGVMPDKVTFTCVLNVCASLATLEKGKEVHADMIKARIGPDIILENALADMYAKCGSMTDAHQVFDNMAKRNVVSWNLMVTGHVQHGCGSEALMMYTQMIGEGVIPNWVTFVGILNACANLAALEKGKEVHADVDKMGIESTIILGNSLVDMYAKCGDMKNAHQVFDNMAKRDVVSWSSLLAGYAQHGCGKRAFEIYEQMKKEGVTPDSVTFVCILNACTSLTALDKGREVHSDIIKAGIVADIILDTALMAMYAKCGSIKDSRTVFDSMAERNVVSWNAMIAGYAQHGCGRESFKIYEQMIREGVMPDKVTFISLLHACASMGTLGKGKEVHADIIKASIVPNVNLENTLVDMYAKCGNINDARQVFDNMTKRDAVSWSAMLAGYARHGCGMEALHLFEQMQQEGLKPDGITFTCVLSVCRHLGLVDEGLHYFDSMTRDHGLTPTVEHFGCMVDLLGRAGQLNEAEAFINKVPIKPDAAVWGTLLGACRIHGNVKLAECVAKSML